MTIFELLILYIAAGSPFAVHAGLQNRQAHFFLMFIRAVPALLTWPITAYKILMKQFFHGLSDAESEPGSDSDSITETRVQKIVERMKLEFRETERSVSFYDFREAIERYVALTAEIRAKQNPGRHKELFEISGHGDPDLAAVCFEQHNRHRLLTHQKRARADFLSVVTSCDGNPFSRNGILKDACQIAELLEDSVAAEELRSCARMKIYVHESYTNRNIHRKLRRH